MDESATGDLALDFFSERSNPHRYQRAFMDKLLGAKESFHGQDSNASILIGDLIDGIEHNDISLVMNPDKTCTEIRYGKSTLGGGGWVLSLFLPQHVGLLEQKLTDDLCLGVAIAIMDIHQKSLLDDSRVKIDHSAVNGLSMTLPIYRIPLNHDLSNRVI